MDFIIEEVRKHPGELTIVEIGPCSNLALAVLKAPDIVPLIKRVIFMGGSFFKPGNVTPTAEFNWWFDPEAARIVVRTPFQMCIRDRTNGGTLHNLACAKAILFLCRYVTPILIVIILLNGLKVF